jgi:hypothetical protein
MVSRRHRFFAVSGETTVGFFTAETAWLGETAPDIRALVSGIVRARGNE